MTTVDPTPPRTPPPRRRITISDIARRAGVSIGAVSYALNDRPGVSVETRARVKQVAADLGWAPSTAARSLSASRTGTIGLVLTRDPRTLGVEQFFMRFIAGIEEELSPRDQSLLLQVVPSLDVEMRTLKSWHASRRVDGVILVDLRVDDPRLELMESLPGLPHVVAGDPEVAPGSVCVWTDDAAATRECVRFLASLGHRRIARISGIAGLAHTAIRDEAFRREVAAGGMVGAIARTDYTPEEGLRATRSLLLSDDAPTAIIYDNDVTALAGMGVAEELGRSIPDDLSIVAWDDSPLCVAARPQLTALGHDIVSHGSHTARVLMKLIDGEPVGSELDSRPTLIVRGSTARVDSGR